MTLELKEPTLKMKDAYLDYIADWERTGEPIIASAARLDGRSYEEWLDLIRQRAVSAPEGLVPASLYVLCDETGRIYGVVDIRHKLNDYLLQFGGHIGYGIRPSERRKGYAAKQLALALPIAKSLGINRALITCNRENIGSARTIQKNGGVLENEVQDGERITQRYWIDLA